MHINDLPDDVLTMVLWELLPLYQSEWDTFRDSLPLLSICRRWRQLALPMVYDTVHVCCSTQMIHLGARHVGNYSESSGLESVEVATNLDLAVAAGCVNVVRRVVVDVSYLANPLPGFSAACGIMHAAAERWEGARALVLAADSRADCMYESRASVADLVNVSRVGGLLTAMLPGVRELCFGGASQSLISLAIYGHVAGHYAGQLEVLASEHPIPVPHDRLFTQLKYVAINGSNVRGYQLPQMCPERIEHLDIEGFPADFSWAAFSAGSGNQAIEFPKLKSLRVVYGKGYVNDKVASPCLDGHSWALRFPVLKDLTVSCLGSTCPLLENAVYPEPETVAISASPAIYRFLATTALSAARRLTLSLPRQYDVDASALAVVNGILSRAGACKERELDVGGQALYFTPEDITCTGLTQLRVTALVDVDTMLELISRLPRLAYLTLTDLILDDFQSDISIPESVEHDPVPPLDTAITRLSITMRELESCMVADLVVKCMLLRMPTLTDLEVVGLPEMPIMDFVDDYCQWYPHLAHVDIALEAEDRYWYLSE